MFIECINNFDENYKNFISNNFISKMETTFTKEEILKYEKDYIKDNPIFYLLEVGKKISQKFLLNMFL